MSLKQKKILIADDSRLVADSISLTLKLLGFDSDNISFATKPAQVMSLCKMQTFDIVLMDYNFNVNVNGHQLYNELKHFELLPATTIFIYITGENSAKIVKSILDSGPDGFVLKPFNPPTLKRRLQAIIRCKESLMAIYQSLENLEYQSVIDECDKLEPLFPEYSLTIKRMKADAMVTLEKYTEAKEVYQNLLAGHNADWVKVSLANVMILNGEIAAAKLVLGDVEDKDTNHLYHDEMSNVNLEEEDIPKAIYHLKTSSMLLDSSLDRDLVIANLSVAYKAYDDAFKYIQYYMEKNIGTYRDNDSNRLIYIYYFLLKCVFSTKTFNIKNALSTIYKDLNKIQSNKELSFQCSNIYAIINLLQGDHATSYRYLNEMLSVDGIPKNLTFYDYFFYMFTLEKLSRYSELNKAILSSRDAIETKKGSSVVRSQIYMQSSLEKVYIERFKRVNLMKRRIEQRHKSKHEFSEILEDLLVLHDILPYSDRVCLAVVKFLANNVGQYHGRYDIGAKVSACHSTLSVMSEPKLHKQYCDLGLYAVASKNVATIAAMGN
ncbi:response regulator [Photobacterium rosenbergii]|uniref:Response regulator n=1 Tax=Photobacterium rosenbergii TaxID=294936 RepID=A0ABU3ZK70_9GAMM|nr:response regulator [Photobacterium rosenbergii]MDV5170393.1 response regulator [Photobacterium rosenbergii]